MGGGESSGGWPFTLRQNYWVDSEGSSFRFWKNVDCRLRSHLQWCRVRWQINRHPFFWDRDL